MNRLAHEHSPYLKEHSANPVDWYPWGEEAFNRAKSEDKPVFLSIGYSTCHWCHVMRRESFEDYETAKIMNDNFINIKVDREEYPDIDAVYMDAVQALGLAGGWPLNVFLTPQKKPIYGFTYAPKKSRLGMPSFKSILNTIADSYWNRKEEILRNSEEMVEQLKATAESMPKPSRISADLADKAFTLLRENYDPVNGGFGRAPKFPNALVLDFLLKYHKRTGQNKALEMVDATLQKMAEGGIFDQVGGGFHRYTADAKWFVPHFEKMLYDNALLANIYIQAFQVTGNIIYKYIGERTIKYILREMTNESGGFYSGQDAESEGREGKFYTWSYSELKDLLSDEELQVAKIIYQVSEAGNYHGSNLLHQIDKASPFQPEIEHLNRVLLHERSKRIHPHIDDKILLSWNSLALTALVHAAGALSNEGYRHAALRNANFLFDNMVKDGKLFRSFIDGDAYVAAYLEDFANFVNALIDVYELTFDLKWLERARNIAGNMVEQFWNDDQKYFFDTGVEHSRLIVSPRNIYDTPLPSGSSSAAYALLRLSTLFGYDDWSEIAKRSIENVATISSQYPTSLGMALSNMEWVIDHPSEISIVGNPEEEDTKALANKLRQSYIPNKVMALRGTNNDGYDKIATLKNKVIKGGRATIFICKGQSCQDPVNTVDGLARLIA